jgi:predicted phosphoribosyltransferase
LQALKRRKLKKVVLAVPVAPAESIEEDVVKLLRSASDFASEGVKEEAKETHAATKFDPGQGRAVARGTSCFHVAFRLQ